MDKPLARRIRTDAEFDFQIDAWLKKYGDQPDDFVFAKTVKHDKRLNLLIVNLSTGRRLVLPVEEIEDISGATHEQLVNYKLIGPGTMIEFPNIDVGLSVDALIAGWYGAKRWMAERGRKGGSAKTTAKRRASRANGKKGGRPRKVLDPPLPALHARLLDTIKPVGAAAARVPTVKSGRGKAAMVLDNRASGSTKVLDGRTRAKSGLMDGLDGEQTVGDLRKATAKRERASG